MRLNGVWAKSELKERHAFDVEFSEQDGLFIPNDTKGFRALCGVMAQDVRMMSQKEFRLWKQVSRCETCETLEPLTPEGKARRERRIRQYELRHLPPDPFPGSQKS
jgi:hypothetical protein